MSNKLEVQKVWEVCQVSYGELGEIVRVEVKKTYPLEDAPPLFSDENYGQHLWERLRELREDQDFEGYDFFLQYLIQEYIHLRWELA